MLVDTLILLSLIKSLYTEGTMALDHNMVPLHTNKFVRAEFTRVYNIHWFIRGTAQVSYLT